DVEAFDREVAAVGRHPDRREIGIGREQLPARGIAREALDRDLALEPRDHDAARVGDRGAVHRDQVAVLDPDADDAVAFDPQQEIRARPEQGRIELVARLDMALGEDWRTGRDAPDQGQFEGRATAAPRRQADPASTSWKQFDQSLFSKGNQMLADSIYIDVEVRAELLETRRAMPGGDPAGQDLEDFELARGGRG